MEDFTRSEANLIRVCAKENLPDLEVLLNANLSNSNLLEIKQPTFSFDLLGQERTDENRVVKARKDALSIMKNEFPGLLTGEKTEILYKGDRDFHSYFMSFILQLIKKRRENPRYLHTRTLFLILNAFYAIDFLVSVAKAPIQQLINSDGLTVHHRIKGCFDLVLLIQGEQVKNKIVVLGQARGLDFRVDTVFREDGGGACQRRCHGARERASSQVRRDGQVVQRVVAFDEDGHEKDGGGRVRVSGRAAGGSDRGGAQLGNRPAAYECSAGAGGRADGRGDR